MDPSLPRKRSQARKLSTTSWADCDDGADVLMSEEDRIATSTLTGSFITGFRKTKERTESVGRTSRHRRQSYSGKFSTLRLTPPAVYRPGETSGFLKMFGPYLPSKPGSGEGRLSSHVPFTPIPRRVGRSMEVIHPLGVPYKRFASHQRNTIDDYLVNCMTQLARHEEKQQLHRTTPPIKRSAGARLFELLAYEPQGPAAMERTHSEGTYSTDVATLSGPRLNAPRAPSAEAAAVINNLWAGNVAKRAAAIRSFRSACRSSSPLRQWGNGKATPSEANGDAEGQDVVNKWVNNNGDGMDGSDVKNSTKKKLSHLRSMTRETVEAVAEMRIRHKKMASTAKSHMKLRRSVAREEKRSQKLEKMASQCKDAVERVCLTRKANDIPSGDLDRKGYEGVDGFLSNVCLIGQRSALRREKAALESAVTAAETELVEKLAQKDRAGVLFGSGDGIINAADIRKRNDVARSYLHCHLIKRSIDALKETERQLLGKTKEAGKRINKLSTRVKEAKEILLQHEDVKEQKHIPKHKLQAPPPLDINLTSQPATIFHLTDVPQW